MKLRIAALQMVSLPDLQHNLAEAETLLQEAKQGGAEMAVLPENFLTLGMSHLLSYSLQQELIEKLQNLAKAYEIWLVAGTVPLAGNYRLPPASEGGVAKPFATTLVMNSEGDIVSDYRKMHLFDAQVNDELGQYRESDQYNAGCMPGYVQTPWGIMGLAICYDLRFPEYFRTLHKKNVSFVCLPSAFTYTTGQAHWNTLVRARAIDNQYFIVAANQGGDHTRGRKTWGESMIVNPWGNVLSTVLTGVGVAISDIDFDELAEIRKRMPLNTLRDV